MKFLYALIFFLSLFVALDVKTMDWFDAVVIGDMGRVRELIENRADLNINQTLRGDTALHLAAFYGHLEIVELLVEKGAIVNAQNLYGSTPLHKAVYEKHIELAQKLLLHGADVNIVNWTGHKLLDHSSPQVRTELQDYVNSLNLTGLK